MMSFFDDITLSGHLKQISAFSILSELKIVILSKSQNHFCLHENFLEINELFHKITIIS